MREHLNPAVFQLQRSSIREYSNLAAATPDCIRLTLGEPEFDTPAPITDALFQAVKAKETHYIANNGAFTLRERIAQFETEQNGFAVSAKDVIVTAGATEGLMIAFTGIIAPGDEVIIPTPAFVLYEQLVRLCGGIPVPLDTTGDDFQIRHIQDALTPRTKAIVLNTPHNPTGTILDEESLRQVHDAVAGKPIFVICDDVYRQLVYTDTYHSFTEYDDIRKQIILIQSYSKPYAMTGWRLGYLIAHPDILERLELIHQYSVTSTPSLFQRAGMAALEVDPTPFVQSYRKRRDYVLERLQKMGLPLTTPLGAFYAFPRIAHLTHDSGAFCKELITRGGVALTPGACFGAEGYVRLSYCCSEKELKIGLDRLEQFIQNYKAQ